MQQSFWDFLLSSSKKQWGLMVYEQDWLDYTEEFMSAVFVSAIRRFMGKCTCTILVCIEVVPRLDIWYRQS